MLAINLIQAILCLTVRTLTVGCRSSADWTVAGRREGFITAILICKCEFFSILHSDLIEVINSSCGESLAIKCFKCAVSISEPIQRRLIES